MFKKITSPTSLGKNRGIILSGLFSLALLAISGVVINVFIAHFYGAAALGYVNIVISIFLVSSQIGTLGIQYSILKYCSENYNDNYHINRYFNSGFISILLLSLLLAFMGFIFIILLKEHISYDLFYGLILIVIGIVPFQLNKYYINFSNGLGCLIKANIYISIRYLLITIFTLFFVLIKISYTNLPLIVIIPEFILLFITFIDNYKYLNLSSLNKFDSKKIIFFGVKALPGGALQELNSKIDIIVIGIFCSQSEVGNYSFVAMILDGLQQIPAIIRKYLDVKISYLYSRSENLRLIKNLKKSILSAYLLTVPVVVLLYFIYPIAIDFIQKDGSLSISKEILNIFLIFFLLTCGIFSAFGFIQQSGYPLTNSGIVIFIFLLNLALNFLFVPVYGVFGAAFIAGSVYVIQSACTLLAFRLLLFRRT